ncbi:MAG: chemotaxis response regulator protein-glutamate methylesterase [SAR324 cluster bacterium]|uniref:Protein-glutamate methylesterase/protein-glutamine glutaminase n=1 Tax=SAR324 cluster bacterium TaxID=2024889 RepID=A0A2A4TA82_9DELT|nr:MAG: chemotaxis response regulator protein-glutamate methylesterase [SAR324 cluster bacterium]
MNRKVRVMVVDDTITYRQILSKVAEMLPKVQLVGTASSGKTALMKIPSLKPDLIFLDVMMPEMDGIETLRRIKQLKPSIQVVMVSAFDMENAKVTLDSLKDGALDFVAKPTASSMQEGIAILKGALNPMVEVVFEQLFGNQATPVVSRPRVAARTIRPVRKVSGKQFNMIVLGISTGGPNALYKMFESIKTRLPCPVLIVQHMPPMFTKSLAERLDSISPMEICEAADGDIPENGKVYIAPGGKHMVVRSRGDQLRIAIIDSPPVNHCKPAVDVLFRSVGLLKNINNLSVIMTGMGRDGTEGVRMLKRSGTYCLIQDQDSSVVWGMPGSVDEAGLMDETLPLEKMGGRIVELTS